MENELFNRLLLSCFSLTHAHHCFLLFFYHSIINISTTDYDVLELSLLACALCVACFLLVRSKSCVSLVISEAWPI